MSDQKTLQDLGTSINRLPTGAGRADSTLHRLTVAGKPFYVLRQRGRFADIACDHSRLLAGEIEQGVLPEILSAIARATDLGSPLKTGVAAALFRGLSNRIVDSVSSEFREAIGRSMPFDGTDPRTAKAAAMIDALLAYFDEGKKWLSSGYRDENGRRCRISAMALIRHRYKSSGDPTSHYIRLAASLGGRRAALSGIIGINDSCDDYQELAAILERARALAAAGRGDHPNAKERLTRRAARHAEIEAQRRQTRRQQLLAAIHKAECAFREAADRYAADHGERSTFLDERIACAQREFASVEAASA